SSTPAVSRAETNALRCFNTLLAATTADDYDQFVSVGDDAFRGGITPDTFHSLSQSLAARMKSGCTPTYLGQFRQNGDTVSLWHLAFTDGSDDRLARVSLSLNGVDGFVITPAF